MSALSEEQARAYMHKLLATMSAQGGSDLFISNDFPPSMKAHGAMTPLSQQKLTGDVTKVLAVPDLLKLYMQPAVIALAEKIESDLLALSSQFTANAPVGTAGTAVTENVVDLAETALFRAKLPASVPKHLIVDADTYSQLRQIARFSEYRTAGEAGLRALVDGTVGKMKDFYIFRSQFVQKTGSAPATTHNVAFAKDAIGLVVRRLPQPIPGTGAIAEYAELGNFGIRVMMSYQPNTLAQQFTVDVLYGCGILRNNFGVQVLS